MNPNITLDIIKGNPDKSWNWNSLSMNPNVTVDFIKANLHRPWNWYWISKNKNISWDFIAANLNLPWDWNVLSSSEDINWDIIEKNPHQAWNFFHLSNNKAIHKPSPGFKAKFLREWHARNVIKRYWFHCSTNPDYKLCIRRLKKYYDELIEINFSNGRL